MVSDAHEHEPFCTGLLAEMSELSDQEDRLVRQNHAAEHPSWNRASPDIKQPEGRVSKPSRKAVSGTPQSKTTAEMRARETTAGS
jgi:hypothetical protein